MYLKIMKIIRLKFKCKLFQIKAHHLINDENDANIHVHKSDRVDFVCMQAKMKRTLMHIYDLQNKLLCVCR